MGLDLVELVISIEGTFDISIDDQGAEQVVTVYDCYKLILSNLNSANSKT